MFFSPMLMPPVFRLHSLLTFALLAFCLLVGIPGGVQAIPPPAPSNGTFSHTWFGVPFNNPENKPTSNWHSWYLTWQDNATDEQGYTVSVRYGTVGPFTTFAALPADSTTASFSIGNLVTALVIPVQFRIEAWKYNGAATESSALNLSTTLPKTKPAGVADFATPAGLTAVLQDLDPSPEVTRLSDGLVKLTWDDTSNGELGFEVGYREIKAGMTDASWINIGTLPFNTESLTLSNLVRVQGSSTRLTLVPGKPYQFRLRAHQGQGNTPSNYVETKGFAEGSTTQADAQALVMPELAAPTDLNATGIDESTFRLSWTDNSQNETGYSVEYRIITSGTPPAFSEFGTVGENVTNVAVPVTPNASAEFRVRAKYTYTPAGGSATTLYSAYTANTALTSTTTFAAPTELVAVPHPGQAHAINLTWKDNSSAESGFEVLVKESGTTAEYKFARALQADVTQVTMDSIAGTVSADGLPTDDNFVPLTPGTAYEFVVRAVGSPETIVSASSSPATATPRHGFTMPRLYHPAKVGQPLSYQLTTSNDAARTAWNASALPPGLSFDNATGLISGTPTTSGVFQSALTASFTGGTQAEVTLTFRVLGLDAPPQPGTPLRNITVGLNSPITVNLAGSFTDADTEAAVRLETTRGNLDIKLYPSLTPQAVANFLAYVNGGDYDNMAFHRLAYNPDGTPFVLQGGSIGVAGPPDQFYTIGKRPSPLNEPGISNLRGTISAAKIGGRTSLFNDGFGTVSRDEKYGYVGLPNSATTDFFLNPVNNAANLDNQNGGFTAFGRLTEASLLILDQITALPRGAYTDQRSETNTADSFDRRVLVNGSKVGFSDFPMNLGTAPTNMDNSRAVRVISAYQMPILNYTVNEVSTDKASVAVENGQLKITGLAAGERQVQVTARDVDGQTSTQSFTITVTPGFQPPVITRQPGSLIVKAGAAATFAVTVSGTPPSFQWRRNGVDLPGRNGPTLGLTNVQAGDAGAYDVVVTSGGLSVLSSPATLTVRTAADITSTLPPEVLVDVGSALDLSLTFTGTPAPVFTWRRGSTVLKGQTSSRLLIEKAALTDAGSYSATATNGGTTDKSNNCSVLVVDKTRRTVVAAPGKPIKLTAPAAGPFTAYSWRKGGSLINEPGFSGVNTATLSIASARLDTDTGDYTCVLTPPGSLPVTISGIVRLAVSNPPQLSPFAPGTGIVGLGYSHAIAYSATDSNTPVSFTAKGLPPGLSLNATTGVISGIPTRAGTYSVTVQASNPAGRGPAVTGNLRIQAPDAAGAGTYMAIVNSHPALNSNKGGRLDLTLTDSSSWTARLLLGKESHTLKGVMRWTQSPFNSGSFGYTSNVTIASKTYGALLVLFELDPGNGNLTGIITSNSATTDFFGYRLSWHPDRNPWPYSTGPFNLAITPRPDQLSRTDIPQGDGFLSLNVTRGGIGSATVRLADGTSFTSSAIMGATGQFGIFKMLYPKDTGSFLSRITFGLYRQNNQSSTPSLFVNNLTGNASWTRDPQPATDRSYAAGFSLPQVLRGWAYSPPLAEKTPIVLNLPNMPGNARLEFEQGGVASASPNPSLTFRLTNANSADFTGVLNPAKVSLKMNTATGAYSGLFELTNGGVTRKTTFQGLLIPAMEAVPGLAADATRGLSAQAGVAAAHAFGAGFFLLDQLPVPPSTKSTSVLSGRARLMPAPVLVSPQPQSQTVNPGANVNFSFTATPTLTTDSSLSYQWRKNGINISGATTTTLALTNVQEADEASYDCVIRQTITIQPPVGSPAGTLPTELDVNETVTQAAVLTVNDPVSQIIVLQNPGRSPVPTGSSVTFTVEHAGTPGFTYQWKKDGIDIAGANSASYTIPAVTNAQNGSYTVLVSNAAAPAGVSSAARTLSHVSPITNLQISRTPSESLLAAGTRTTFTATADGGGVSYQWLRNGLPLPGANASTFVINSPTASDNGLYTVLATNGATPDGISSAGNVLNVTNAISNIVVTPSFSNGSAATNTDVTLSVAQSGTGPFTYQWRKNGTPLSGETASTLAFNTGPQPTSSAETYDVLISNAAVPLGVLSPGVALAVDIPVSDVTASRSPTDETVGSNTQVVFSVTATGSNLTYQWLRNGIAISDATGATYTIPATALANGGNYTVRVKNSLTPNGVLSNEVPLDVNDPVSAATITLTNHESTTVPNGATLTFNCNPVGGYGHTFIWKRNGQPIPGATSSFLNTVSDTEPGTIRFEVQVFNPLNTTGVTSNEIVITVEPDA